MKKSFVVATVLAACTVVPTFMTGFAQAQQATERVEEVQAQSQQINGPRAPIGNLNQLFTGVCRVGPRTTDVIFTCTGIGFSSASPRAVFCQLRNSPTDPTAYPDQFACQVIRTGIGSVTVRIRRIDDGTGPSGWGQNLYLNLFIVN